MPKFPNIIRIEEIQRRLRDREGKYNDQTMTMFEKKIEAEKDKIAAEDFEEFKEKVLEFANTFEYWILFKDEAGATDVMAFDVRILDLKAVDTAIEGHYIVSMAVNSPIADVYIVIEDVEVYSLGESGSDQPTIVRKDEAEQILQIVNRNRGAHLKLVHSVVDPVKKD